MRRKLFTTLLMFAVLVLASCSKDDGDWDPMVWKADVPVQITDGIYHVSADGGTLTFTCKNYSKPWFSYAQENGEDIQPPYIDEMDYGLIYSQNFRAEIHGNKLTIDFEANESSQTRNISITVTAGDIFYTFQFKQLATSD